MFFLYLKKTHDWFIYVWNLELGKSGILDLDWLTHLIKHKLVHFLENRGYQTLQKILLLGNTSSFRSVISLKKNVNKLFQISNSRFQILDFGRRWIDQKDGITGVFFNAFWNDRRWRCQQLEPMSFCYINIKI